MEEIQNWSRINISWQNQRLLLLCQTRLIPCIPNVLQCSAVTPPSITRRVFSRQGSLFYPSVNQHPQADSPGSSCQTTQHLPPHWFATKCLAFTWLCAPPPSLHPSRLSRIKQETSCTSIQHRGITPLHYWIWFVRGIATQTQVNRSL